MINDEQVVRGKIIFDNFLSSMLLCLIKLGVDSKNGFNRASYFPKHLVKLAKRKVGWLREEMKNGTLT